MNERHAHLIAGYLDGALSEAERDELLRALQADADLAAALADELQIHRTLQFAASGGPGEDRRSADRILQFVRATLDGANFLERVKDRAREESSSRRLYLPRRRTATRTSYAVPFAVAAALFVGFLLIVSFATSGKPAPTAKEAPRKKEVREAMPAPAPAPAPEERKPNLEPERPPAPPKTPDVPQEERRPEPPPPQTPTPPKPDERPAPSPVQNPAAPKTETKPVLALATLERVEGQVMVQKVSVKVGRALLPDEGVETKGTSARAVLKFADGTLVEVGGGIAIRELRDREGAGETGMWIDLSGQGFLSAQVAKQPQGRALVIATPHGEAKVLGTTLRVVVEPNWTRLEVTEGHVRLTRKADGKMVDVLSGHYAMAATGLGEPEFASRAIPPDVITVNFGPEEFKVRLPEGVLNDSGEEFDAKRGYGWIGPKLGRDVVQPFTDPNTGKPLLWKAGRSTGFHEKEPGVDIKKSTYLAAGSIAHSETWVMPLPNGRYLVTICVGGTYWKQGPHHVDIDGVQIVNRVFTRAADHYEARDIPVEIKDGELTLVAGKFPGKTTDPSSDTILNYLIIKRPKAK